MGGWNIKSIKEYHKLKIKNAQAFEAWFFVIVALLAFAIFFLVLGKAWDSVKTPLNEGLLASMPSNPSVNVTKTIAQTTGIGTMFDKLIPFLLIGLFAFVLIMAGTIMRHPIMIFVGIIILGVVILIAVVYSNLYHSISSADEFASTTAGLPIQDKFMQYLPVIVFIMAIGIIAGIIYNKQTSGGGI